jgi:hypothetical protein
LAICSFFNTLGSATDSVQVCPSFVWKVIDRWAWSTLTTVLPLKLVAASLGRTVEPTTQHRQRVIINAVIDIFIYAPPNVRRHGGNLRDEMRGSFPKAAWGQFQACLAVLRRKGFAKDFKGKKQ